MSTIGNQEGRRHRPKKYSLDTKEDPKTIFNYPYLIDDDTISYIKNRGRVMFMIRGLPCTKKTKLSRLLQECYPDTSYCSAVKHLENFREIESSSSLGPDIVGSIVGVCLGKVEKACCLEQPTIIVQNTHVEKREMKKYMEFAIQNDYIIIMISTMNQFHITPNDLWWISRESGLDIQYLISRFGKWQDVPPLFTAWFISSNDSEYIRQELFGKLKTLVEIKQFSSSFNTHDVLHYFHPRKNLSCLAGYTANKNEMIEYDFSKDVQEAYGKCFPIFFIGYFITKSDIIGVAHLDKDVKSLLMDNSNKYNRNVSEEPSRNVLHYGETTKFLGETTKFLGKDNLQNTSAKTSKIWVRRDKGEKIPIEFCRPIHIAQKSYDVFNIDKLNEQFNEGLQLISDKAGIIRNKYFDLKNGNSRCYRLNDDMWFLNISGKFRFSTIFTGFYT